MLRGLAALTVVFSHYIPYWNSYIGDIPVLVPNSVGSYAVDVFFIISGFVIILTLEKCHTVTDFAVLRFSRLYPAYWTSFALVLLISVLVFDGQFSRARLLANVTMFQEYLGFGHFDNVYWSLSVELAFYLNVAWLLAFGLTNRMSLIACCWLLASCVWATSDLEPAFARGQRDWAALLFALDYSPFFSIGIVFYEVKKFGWNRTREFALLLALITVFVLDSWEGFIVAVVGGMLVWLGLNNYLRFLTGKLTLWLGAVSYSLYLTHRNLGYYGLTWMHERGMGESTSIAAMVMLILLVSTAITYGAERPLMRRIRHTYSKHKR